jgi:hypothetical protein
MEKLKFGVIKVGDNFIHDNWIHTKINESTAIAHGYAASDSMDAELEVTKINLDAMKYESAINVFKEYAKETRDDPASSFINWCDKKIIY